MKKILFTVFALILYFALPSVSDAAFAINATSSVNFTAVTSFSINLPPGTANNNLLVCTANNSANSGAQAYISSWDGCNTRTIINNDALGGSNISVAYKIASSEPASYTWQYAASRMGSASIVAYSGVDTGSPFQATSTAASTADPKVTPAILPDQDNSMLVGIIWFDPNAGNSCLDVVGNPLRVFITNSSNATHCVSDRIQTTATSEGVTIDPNTEGTSSWGTLTAVFRAAAGGGGASSPTGTTRLYVEGYPRFEGNMTVGN